MKYLIGLLCLFSVAQAQFAPTSAKTKFVNGIGIGSKDTSQFTAADTIALTIARDSVMYYRYRGFWRPIATGGNLSAYKLISDTLFANGYTTRARLKQGLDSLAATKGTVNSVGLTMPSAFNVANSPITSSGTIAVTAAGNATQYIRGDGALATLPTSGSGGGASVSYYLNGSVNQGTIGGVTYYEMNKTPIIGAGTNFSITADGYIASFLTDANDPALLKIPAGNWNFETYFSASSGGGSPTFYIELYKYNGTTFTLIASNSTSPKLISDGTNIEAYFSTLAVPETVLTLTDRLAVRIYVSHSGRTITLHTENGHLCQIITTFTTGLTALNGLTEQVQYFSTGTSGTDFNIASSVATHTFNLPTASATNRGALSTTDWTTFNNKIGAGDTAAMLAPYYRTATATAALATKLNISDTAAMLSPYARTANLPSLAPYKLISDTLFNNGYTTRGTTKKVIDSLAALELNISDTAAMLLGYTRVQRFTDSLTNVQSRIQTKQNILTLTTTGTSGAATLTGATLNIPNYAPDLSGYVPTSRTITINGTSQDLSANRTFNVGTVTSVTASSPLASSGGTTPNISITQASGSTNGFLSSTDWTTFNNKQNALTNPVTGSGTTNYLPKFTGTSTIGNSTIFESGGLVGIGTNNPLLNLQINSASGSNSTLAFSENNSLKWYTRYNAGDGSFSFVDVVNTATRLIITNSGNLGLGVTPSAWANTRQAIQLMSGTIGSNIANDALLFIQNAFNDGTNWKYVNNGFASRYYQNSSGHFFDIAPSGTAGNAITFTQAMTLGANGNLLLGTTTDNGARLQVSGNGTFSSTLTVNSETQNVMLNLNSPSSGRSPSVGFSVGSSLRAGIQVNVSTFDMGLWVSNFAINALNLNASTGAATFSSLAGTGTRMVTANSSGQLEATQVVTWNSYTASVGDRINHTCGTTAVFPRYTVVGNIVTVQGTVSVGCITSADTYTEFSIPLPITGSATTGSAIMIGTGTLIDGNGKTANSANYRVVNVDLSAGKAYVNFYPRTNGNSSNVSFFFQYSIN